MTLKLHTIPVTSFQQNATILWDDKTRECILTDVGGNNDKLLAYITEKKLKPQAIWLTHGHFDHIGGVAEFLTHYPVPVLGPNEGDRWWVENLPAIASQYGFPATEAFIPTKWLKDGETLTIGPYSFTVLAVPGHTAGHVAFYAPKLRLLIAGDTLFQGSIGRSDLPGGDGPLLIKSIKEKLLTLPENTTVVTGHGPFTTIGAEKKHNPFLQDQN